ncbi:MAG: sigma-70 family RNA polymerase sigma factor [Acidobacteria bacterium]|nr:sigma-70 family RNA polymerase sigma factor [Acidobacteriota bacterium]
MDVTNTPSVTQLLLAWSNGDAEALEQLVPLVQAELRRIAKRYMRRERAGHLLQTSALVNEAYLRLIDWQNVQWESRAHFFGVAAQLMRRVLVDEARERNQLKRGGDALRVSLSEAEEESNERPMDLLALDDALKTLAKLDSRKSEVVVLRFFGGLSLDESAEFLKISRRTVAREWDFAKTWLFRELSKNPIPGD